MMIRSLFILSSICTIVHFFSFASSTLEEESEKTISCNEVVQERPIRLYDIQSMMKKLFEEHIISHKMTPEIALRSHEKFFDFFDPDKIFLLQSEVDQYCSPQKGDLYVEEWKQQIFSSFEEMIRTIQDSIQRARRARRTFFSAFSMKEIDRITQLDRIEERDGNWPATLDEIDIRQKLFICDQLSHRLGAFTTSSPTEIRRTIREIELELQKRENEWLFISSEEGTFLPAIEVERSLADKIMRAYGASLDPHSAILTEKEAEKLQERLSKEVYGIGIGCSIRNGTELVVESIDPFSPAGKKEKEIEKGDAIISINGISVSELLANGHNISTLFWENRALSKISLFLQKGRSKETQNIILEKEWYISQDGRLSVQTISTSLGDAYVLRFDSFYASSDGSVSTEGDLRLAFDRISAEVKEKKRDLLGIILDLRSNRGGYLMQAVKSAGLFIKSGIITTACYADGREKKPFRDLDPTLSYSGPLIMLTSVMTASAAEVFVEALQSYGVGLIVGDEKTYGKGSIQMQTVTDGSSSHLKAQKEIAQDKAYFKVTVGQYYSVTGKSIQKEGVHADLIVPSLWHNQQIGERFLPDALERGAKIETQFQDDLQDIPSHKKAWMKKQYLPFLQKPDESFRLLAPKLQMYSAIRMKKSARWEAFLSGGRKEFERYMKSGNVLSGMTIEQEIEKMQLEEALSILEDIANLSGKRAVIYPIKA